MFWTHRMRSLHLCCNNGNMSLGQSKQPNWNTFVDYYRNLVGFRQHCSLETKQEQFCKAAGACPSTITEKSQNTHSCESHTSPYQMSSYPYHSHRLFNNGPHDLKRFLEVGSDPRESRYWLKQFQHMTDAGHPFAVIQVDEDVVVNETMLEKFSSAIAFLHRNGMDCIIVLGVQLGGDSVESVGSSLPCPDLQKKRELLNQRLRKLVTALERHHTPIRTLFGGSSILQTDSQNNTVITKVNRELVDWCLQSSFIPVITAQGETPSGQLTLLDPTHASEELAKVFTPLKVMFLNTEGGLKDKRGRVVSNVNLPLDLEDQSYRPWGAGAARDKISRIYSLLTALPRQSSVVSMSADSILTELFTHTGSGTFFKITEPIHRYTSFDHVDKVRLLNLINKAFGKDLKADYFDYKFDKINTLYLSEGYSAAAIITNEPGLDIPYLDKFVVSSEAQGQGTSDMIWNSILADFPSLFWRSMNTNKINPWYFKKCDGSYVHGEWIVFWYGIDHRRGSQIIDFATALETSFVGPDSGQNSVVDSAS